jgi:F0F1-type ATP synthase beta subunit
MNPGSINNNFDKNNTSRENLILGMVTTIRGSIVEVQFEKNLRSINSVIRAGNKLEIIIEVQLQPQYKTYTRNCFNSHPGTRKRYESRNNQ